MSRRVNKIASQAEAADVVSALSDAAGTSAASAPIRATRGASAALLAKELNQRIWFLRPRKRLAVLHRRHPFMRRFELLRRFSRKRRCQILRRQRLKVVCAEALGVIVYTDPALDDGTDMDSLLDGSYGAET